jgi:hypothetical protein
MTKNFKPIFTITNRITAGPTRLPVLPVASATQTGARQTGIERVRGFLEAACLRRGFGRQG